MKNEYDFSKARPGKKAKKVKVIKSFRLDPEILLWLESEGKKQGMGYQTFLNWFLRKSMGTSTDIEERIERIEAVVFRKKGQP